RSSDLGALDGIKVFEFANYVSGPYAGMLLSDLGAEVVKVETPDGGDPFRMWGKTDYNGTFGSMNRNKKSITLDLKTAAGQAAARRLALSADVIIENFRPGGADGAQRHWARAKGRNVAPASDTRFSRRERGEFFRRQQSSVAGDAMSARAGLCLYGRRRAAVRHPSLIAGKILAGFAGGDR